MKKLVKVYDIKITTGQDTGFYRIFGVADKVRAEQLAAEFSQECGTGHIVIEREEEVVEFRNQDDIMNWFLGEE